MQVSCEHSQSEQVEADVSGCGIRVRPDAPSPETGGGAEGRRGSLLRSNVATRRWAQGTDGTRSALRTIRYLAKHELSS